MSRNNFLESFLLKTSPLYITNYLIIVGFIVYGNSLANRFVWDDLSFIINNPSLSSISILSVWGQNIFNTSSFYRPLQGLYFSYMHYLFYDLQFFYHFSAIALHSFCAIGVFFIGKKFLRKDFSFFLAMLFLIHPVQVESVVYVMQTTSMLHFLPGIVALILFTKGKLSKKDWGFLYVLLLIAAFVKETGLFFAGMIVIYAVLFKIKDRYKSIILLTFVVLSYLYVRLIIGHSYFSLHMKTPLSEVSLIDRLLNIPSIILYYISTFIFPMNLAIGQDWIIKEISFTHFYLPLVIDTVILGLAGSFGYYLYTYYKDHYRAYIFFSLWFIAGMLPLLQISPLTMTVADRWFYIPIVGIIGMIMTACEVLVLYRPRYLSNIYIIILIIGILLAMRTIIRNRDWYDEKTLYLHDSKITQSSQVEANLGVQYANEKNYHDALIHFENSIKLYPNPTNVTNLGTLYAINNQGNKARELFYQLFTFDKRSPKTLKSFFEYASFMIISHDTVENACTFTEKALYRSSDSDILWVHKAYCLYKTDQLEKAEIALSKAKEITDNQKIHELYKNFMRSHELQENDLVDITNKLPL